MQNAAPGCAQARTAFMPADATQYRETNAIVMLALAQARPISLFYDTTCHDPVAVVLAAVAIEIAPWSARPPAPGQRRAPPAGRGLRLAASCSSCSPLGSLTQPRSSWSAATTYRGTGANLATLATANVTPATFGKLVRYKVDGFVYAQPLLVSGLSVGGRIRNVLYVATTSSMVYALNAGPARHRRRAPVWQARLTEQGSAESARRPDGSDGARARGYPEHAGDRPRPRGPLRRFAQPGAGRTRAAAARARSRHWTGEAARPRRPLPPGMRLLVEGRAHVPFRSEGPQQSTGPHPVGVDVVHGLGGLDSDHG